MSGVPRVFRIVLTGGAFGFMLGMAGLNIFEQFWLFTGLSFAFAVLVTWVSHSPNDE